QSAEPPRRGAVLPARAAYLSGNGRVQSDRVVPAALLPSPALPSSHTMHTDPVNPSPVKPAGTTRREFLGAAGALAATCVAGAALARGARRRRGAAPRPVRAGGGARVGPRRDAHGLPHPGRGAARGRGGRSGRPHQPRLAVLPAAARRRRADEGGRRPPARP